MLIASSRLTLLLFQTLFLDLLGILWLFEHVLCGCTILSCLNLGNIHTILGSRIERCKNGTFQTRNSQKQGMNFDELPCIITKFPPKFALFSAVSFKF